MKQKHFALRITCLTLLIAIACDDPKALVKSSFGHHQNAKASPASVMSMGRDDDDGLAKKWSIGSNEP